MKFKNTLLLFVIAALFGGYIYKFELGKPDAKTRAENKDKIAIVDRDSVDAVSIKSPEGKIELRKKDGVWFLEEPVKDRADLIAVGGLFTAAEGMKSVQQIDPDAKDVDKALVKESGLENADVKVKFTGKDGATEVALGKDSAIENRIYARVEGQKTIYVIANDIRREATKKADDYRDRKLADVTTTQIQKFQIKVGGNEIEAEKKGDRWVLNKPFQGRADLGKVNDLLSQATNARVDTFLADSANLANYGLDNPRGTLSVFIEGKDQPSVIAVGANPKDEKDKEKTYVKVSSRESVVTVPKAIESLLTSKPNDLRDRNLTRFLSDAVDRIIIEPAGKEKITVARSGENWVRKADKDVLINAAIPNNILSELGSVAVADFVSDVATDLPKYGLESPVLKLTLASFASQDTAEEKKGEQAITTILFGKPDDKGNVYAKLAEEPFIVAVQKGTLERIPTEALELQALEIFQHEADIINTVEVTRAGQPALALQRGEDKTWKLAKGDGKINQLAALSLVNTLAKLRAVRWVGANKPEHGFDKPEVTISFTTNGGTQDKITVGSTTPENFWNAKVEGRVGTFQINDADSATLRAALIETTAASAAPLGAPPGLKPPASAPSATAPAQPAAKPELISVTTPPVSVPPAATAPTAPAAAPAPSAAAPAPVPAPAAPAPAPAPTTPQEAPQKPAPAN